MSSKHQYSVSPIDQLDAATFSTTSFIDLIAWQAQPSFTTGTYTSEAGSRIPPIDAEALLSRFEAVFGDVRSYVSSKNDEIRQMERNSVDAEEKFREATATAQRLNVDAIEKARDLELKVDSISKKIGSFGDAVEIINRPRNNLQNSVELLRIFERFYSAPRGHEDDIVQHIPSTLPELVKYAEITLSLQAAAEQLSDDRFQDVKRRIQMHYDLVQQRLSDNFLQLSHEGNTTNMGLVTSVLSRFQTYNKSVDQFIESFVKNDALFNHSKFNFCVVNTSLKAHQAITEAFVHPQEIFLKFLQQMFSEQIQPYVSRKINSARTVATSLDALFAAYNETDKIRSELCGKFPPFADAIQTMHARMFEKHSENYLRVEEQHLADECGTVLKQMYASFNHQPVPNLNNTVASTTSTMGRILGPSADVLPPAGKTLLTQQAALDILQKHRKARDRCRILTSPSNRQESLVKILDSLLKFVMDELLRYAILIGLLRLQLADSSSSVVRAPDCTFFDIICEVNEIFQLVDKEMAENYVLTITSPALRSACLEKRERKARELESNMNRGLDRQLNLIIAHVRAILASEQKKTDFRPEDLNQLKHGGAQDKSEACEKVCVYLSRVFQDVSRCFDGLNGRFVIADVSLRFFHAIFNHMFSFTYNTTGGDQLLVDVTAYHELIRSMATQQTPLLDFLFTVLHSLCVMLIVEPDKLPSVFSKCEGLSQIDRSTISQFLQLRADARQPRVKDALDRVIQGN